LEKIGRLQFFSAVTANSGGRVVFAAGMHRFGGEALRPRHRRWVRTALRFILRRASNTAMLGDAGHTESPAGTGVRDGESFATENTVRIRESGIRIGLGTDSMHGVIGYEMQWLVEHG
jgi:hypothetical protein